MWVGGGGGWARPSAPVVFLGFREAKGTGSDAQRSFTPRSGAIFWFAGAKARLGRRCLAGPSAFQSYIFATVSRWGRCAPQTPRFLNVKECLAPGARRPTDKVPWVPPRYPAGFGWKMVWWCGGALLAEGCCGGKGGCSG